MATKKKTPSVSELCARVEFLESRLSDFDSLKKRVEILESSLIIANNCQKLLLQKVDDNDQYSRRLNLIVRGLPVLKSATDEDIRRLVIAEIQQLQLPLTASDIDRAHRIRKPFKDKHGKLQVPVIVRFTSWYARNLVYSKRLTSNVFWSADITDRRNELLTEAKKIISNEGSSAHKVVKSAVVDRNCRLVLISRDGRIFSFNSHIELHRAIQHIEDSQAPYEHLWRILENDKYEVGYPVVNVEKIHLSEWLADPRHIYVGPGNSEIPKSKWSNPFNVGIDGSLEEVLTKYRDHITSAPIMFNELGSLRGKVLGCHCDISISSVFCCHAQILQELVGNL